MLLSNPVEEYASLRNGTLASVHGLALAGGEVTPHLVVAAGAASADLEASFTVQNNSAAIFGFLAFVGSDNRAVVRVRVSIGELDATGLRHGSVNVSTDGDYVNASGTRFGGCTHHFISGSMPADLSLEQAALCGGNFTIADKPAVGETRSNASVVVRIRALLDRTTVESFVAGGRAVVTATTREAAARKASGLALFGTAEVGNVKVDARLYSMGCGWLAEPPAIV